MTKPDVSQVIELQREVERLRRQLTDLRAEAADAAMASTRRDYRHEREMSGERAMTAAARQETDAQRDRADAEEFRHANLSAMHEALLRNAEFNRQILAYSTDCIKVLDLAGRLVFMSEGGMRVMEMDDFAPFERCPWAEFWEGDERQKAEDAVAAARAGSLARFEGSAPTAKGNLRWWEVIVSPICGPDGKPEKLLSISRDISERRAAEEHQRVLFDEMHHRMKNTLATVQVLVQQSMRHSPDDMPAAAEAIQHRLSAMGRAHELLMQHKWISTNIDDVVRDAVDAYMGPGVRMEIAGEPMTLSSRATLTFAMLLNELCTNAVKHGAWSNKSGQVRIAWRDDEGAFRFVWTERGGPPVSPPTQRSFGSRLIENVLPHSLSGKATVSFDPAGLAFQFEAPTVELRPVS